MSLPPSSAVDVGVFSNTTNSYKYLFFLSLLDALEKKYRLEHPATQQVGLRELAVGMFVHAWYPRVQPSQDSEPPPIKLDLESARSQYEV